MISAAALDVLRRAGLPVDFAWCSYEAATCWIVVSVEHARRREFAIPDNKLAELIAETLFASHAGWLVPKVIVVDDDIDVTDVCPTAVRQLSDDRPRAVRPVRQLAARAEHFA